MEGSRTYPSTVVFDLGQVLVSPKKLFEDLALACNSGAETLQSSYWKYRDEHELGSSIETFWSAVLADSAVRSSRKLIEQLALVDAQDWTDVRPAAALLLEALHSNGVRIAILSNAPQYIGRMAEKAPWAKFTSAMFFSGDLAMTKFNVSLYAHVDAALNVNPSASSFSTIAK